MTLVVMAAGVGSRYSGRVKQLEKIGPHGETSKKISVAVFPTSSKWIGLTSANDKAVAISFVNELFKLHNYDCFAH